MSLSTGAGPLRNVAEGERRDARNLRVSVLVMTYNHGKLIRQAIDSVLAQHSSFDYEIVISEDCSTDGTRETVMEYGTRFPDRIRLLLSERNLNSLAVVSRGIRACRGEFIALLDGDDYWTNPAKLQLQVEFLDSHPECSACFHNATAVYPESDRAAHDWTARGQKDFMTLQDIWRGNPIATSSLMFRSGLYELPPWYDRMPMPITDWPLHVLNAEHGTIGYIDHVMSAYRIHGGGTYSRLDELTKLEKRFAFYRQMNRNMNYRCDASARNGLFLYFLEWAEAYRERGELGNARFCAWKCLSGRPIRRAAYQRLLRVWTWVFRESARQTMPAVFVGR